MNDTDRDKKPIIRTVLITAAVSLAFAGLGGYMLGREGQPPAATEGAGKTEHEHSADEKQLYTCGMHPWIITEEPGQCPICGMNLVPKKDDAEPAATAAATSSGERKILYWKAPMNPTEIYKAPGKSAMGMDLVPVYEDEVVGGVEVRVDPVTQQNMGIRTARVESGPLVNKIRTYGHITYDETRTAQVSPKISGWIEKLHIDFTGKFVKKGTPLFDIYSPELVTAQEEYLVAFKTLSAMPGDRGKDLVSSARRRLEYWDVAETEIRAIERSGVTRKNVTIRSPFSGVVTHKNAVEGVFVKAGQTIYRVADLSRVWAEAHIYEYELPWVKTGQKATMNLPYQPGKTYTGTVTFVYPYLQRKTRDVVIRLEFDNPLRELKPDMYVDVWIETGGRGEGLLIPSEAVIRSGERNVVFVTRGDGKFTPRDVTLGLSTEGGNVQILSGLAAGEEVVTSGQFLLDSESKLKEAVQKMLEAKTAGTEKEAPKEKPAADAEDAFFKDLEEQPAEPKKDDFFKEM